MPSAASAERLTSVTRAVLVEADHAGRDARQHRLGEAAPLVDLDVGGEQLGALRFQLLVMVLKVEASELISPAEPRAGT